MDFVPSICAWPAQEIGGGFSHSRLQLAQESMDLEFQINLKNTSWKGNTRLTL